MRFHRRQFLKFAGAAVAAPAIARNAFGQTPQVTLKLHHFLPPVSNGHSKLLAPWARKVEADSGNRIKIDLYPSMQLGGTPPQLYDQARDGVADLVWTLPGSTPGRFPRIEVFELPFIANKKAVPNAKAVQDFYEANLRDEFKEVHPICVWAHDAGLVHSNKQVKNLDDMRGLKLRAPTRLAGDALKALGANGIPMPIRAEGSRWLRRSLGSRAGHQSARAGEIPHRHRRYADALHGNLRACDEQAEI
jgi:TRAP-type C4-dicarboxylate transport system substrate-binding protein